MQYTQIGLSGIKVSAVCLGCMGFGDPKAGMHSWTLNEEDSTPIVQSAFDNGINFFDTAIAYQGGTGEQYLGRILKKTASRDKYVIATKTPPRPKDSPLSGQTYIRTMAEASLRNLGTDYIDLYILHMWDYGTPLYEIMDGFNSLVKEGKVRAIGISNCFAYQLAKANALAEKEGFARFESIQGHHNLIFREEEREMLPLCREDHITMTPYSSLASGRLARPAETQTKRMLEDTYAQGKYDATAQQDSVIISRVEEIAARYGVSMTEVALGWLIRRGSIPIAGATKMAQIETIVRAPELKLTDADMAYLEEPYLPHKLVGVMAQNK